MVSTRQYREPIDDPKSMSMKPIQVQACLFKPMVGFALKVSGLKSKMIESSYQEILQIKPHILSSISSISLTLNFSYDLTFGLNRSHPEQVNCIWLLVNKCEKVYHEIFFSIVTIGMMTAIMVESSSILSVLKGC